MLNYILCLSFAMTIFVAFTQDTIVYRQANASFFANNYYLIKTDHYDDHGAFYRFVVTDGLQYWYGEGFFKETRKVITLYYDTTRCQNRVEYITNSTPGDTVSLQWFDCWKDLRSSEIWTTDSLNHVKRYSSDYRSNTVKIPRAELTNKQLSLHHSSFGKLFDFEMQEGADEILIYARDTIFSGTFDITKEKLKKNAYGFMADGIFSKKKRKAQFATGQDHSEYREVISDSSKLPALDSDAIRKHISSSIQNNFNWKNISKKPQKIPDLQRETFTFHFSKNGKFKKITHYFDLYRKKPDDHFFTEIQLYFWKVTNSEYRFLKKTMRTTKKAMKGFPKIETVKFFGKKSGTQIHLSMVFRPVKQEIKINDY